MTASAPRGGKPVLQQVIVRAYKVVGMGVLTAILVGLVVFVTVNVFYFFSDSWVRPIILTRTHPKVIDAADQLAAARQHQTDLAADEVRLRADLAEVERTLEVATRFLADSTAMVPATLATAEQVMLRREFDRVGLERSNAAARQAVLGQQLTDLATRIDQAQARTAHLASTPFARALDAPVTVAFVPYGNVDHVRTGTTLYGCAWGLVRCDRVGKVVRVLDGEVTDHHPHDESLQRGVLVEIELTTPDAAEADVLFAGGKPFWLL
ncbi:MAG: hypothetical protein KA297_21330 [Kofleriaceae bacterium]|nr:hypothetical protein [Kofleriaceae bacterium]MBP6837332.1 hypothetical protein [Kofleriaceae bacterium]